MSKNSNAECIHLIFSEGEVHFFCFVCSDETNAKNFRSWSSKRVDACVHSLVQKMIWSLRDLHENFHLNDFNWDLKFLQWKGRGSFYWQEESYTHYNMLVLQLWWVKFHPSIHPFSGWSLSQLSWGERRVKFSYFICMSFCRNMSTSGLKKTWWRWS